jgi:CRP-like cAMP-binding protein
VIAVEPVELLVVAASAFRGFLNAAPERRAGDAGGAELAAARGRSTAGRVRAADTLGRVSARLVELCDTHGGADESGGVRVTLPITQDELAGWTGSSVESTAKALRALRSLGWVTTKRRAIEVHDLAALRDRAPWHP